MKYYRGKYMIAVYSLLHEGETLLALCDNTKEFAEYLKTTENAAKMALSELFRGKRKFIKCSGKIRLVEFIDSEELD